MSAEDSGIPQGGEGSGAAPGAPSSGDSQAAGSQQPRQETWWYAAGGKSYGPVSEEQLIALARSGHFRRSDYVYAGYIGTWVRADSVHGLFENVGAGAGAGAPVGAPPYVGVPPEGAPPITIAYTNYAGFWIRFLAVFIDNFVVGAAYWAIALPLMAVLSGVMPSAAAQMPPGMPPEFAPFFRLLPMMSALAPLSYGLGWLYFGLMESSKWQATLGKRALGLMVTDMDGRRISFGRASGRYFASLLSGLICSIGYIIGAFTEKKQTLHDMIAGTVCIYGKTEK